MNVDSEFEEKNVSYERVFHLGKERPKENLRDLQPASCWFFLLLLYSILGKAPDEGCVEWLATCKWTEWHRLKKNRRRPTIEIFIELC